MSISEKDSAVMIPSHTLTIAGEDFVIKPFVIRNRTKVLKMVAEMFASIAKTPGLKDMASADILTDMVTVGGDKLVEIYAIVLNKDTEWINDNVTIPDEIALTKLIWEINQFPLLQSQFQKVIGKFTNRPQ